MTALYVQIINEVRLKLSTGGTNESKLNELNKILFERIIDKLDGGLKEAKILWEECEFDKIVIQSSYEIVERNNSIVNFKVITEPSFYYLIKSNIKPISDKDCDLLWDDDDPGFVDWLECPFENALREEI